MALADTHTELHGERQLYRPCLAPEATAGASCPRIIVAGDDGPSLGLLFFLLNQWGFQVETVAGGREAWELFQTADVPTIFILDWIMPCMNGIEVCRKLRNASAKHYPYVLLLAADSEKRHVTEALDAGADDCVSMPFDVSELRARLGVAERIVRLQHDLVRALDILKQQATHDSLTQLLNRGAIMEALGRERERSCRTGNPFCVILGDIDHFKQINDTYGHHAGDETLCRIAAAIRGCLRPFDSVGRYGGEEFLIVVPECNESGALQLAERVRETCCKPRILTGSPLQVVTLSLGVACGRGERSAESMVRAADAALYRAKAGGRNRINLGTPSRPPVS